ncbi:MAG TPA: tetratricopeptide repeat protein [Bacteroidales bacterium]|nr:tetratricopeptide repeat protein [Bacteroidales bacterium]
MLKKIILTIGCVSLLTGAHLVYAQKTTNYRSPLVQYRDAVELFNKEKYGAAQEKFKQLLDTKDYPVEMHANAEYYQAVCALQLYNADAENLMMAFIKDYPENPKVNHGYFELADYYFKKKNYGNALIAFEKTDLSQLNEEELSDYHFKTGYSYFVEQDYANAKKSFFEIINKESKYTAPANYYYAHIAYTEKNYETALKAFGKLLNDENYSKIAPYYMMQIYYYQQKYDEIISLAPALLDSTGNSKRTPEIARIAAEAYYHTERYSEAIPFLELYLQKNTAPLSRKDYYMIAYTYYKANDQNKAIDNFKKISTAENDSLTQLAYYHLAQCYLATDQKSFAMNMFASAYQMDIDKDVQENAMFSYAKLAYETDFNANNEAVNAFNGYIQKYPESDKLDEAYEYLSNIYLTTKNYKDALSSLEKIKKRNTNLNKAYQKIAYLRGMELFNNSELTEAIDLYSKSNKYPLNSDFEIQSYYWTAEAYYRLEKFDSAIVNYQLLQATNGAFGSQSYHNSYYGLGYCYFKKASYSSALSNFKKFITEAKSAEPKIINDAYNRTGDCYFMNKDFANAIENYDKSIQMKLIDADYALYQKALAQGASSKLETKASSMMALIEKYPKSNYRVSAIYELANTYQNLNNNGKAIDYYDMLVREYPNSGYVSQSLLKKGMIYFNEEKDEQALQVLKKVVSDFPGTPESKEALVSIRNVYVDLDRVEDFFVYVKDLPFASVSNAEQDSITYIALENRYMRNDCENAMTGFNDYLTKFPNGAYQIDAHFYLAECQYRSKLTNEALQNYNFVISKPRTKFTEKSLLNSSEINYSAKNYQAALSNYTDLEKYAEYKENILIAQTGQMRCNYQLALYNMAISSSQKLLLADKLPEELLVEAHQTIAKSALEIKDTALALAEFEVVTKLSKSESCAEAKYNIANIYFLQNNTAESEKVAFDLINQVPSYDYWVAKAFILLADTYVKTGNRHQAKYTLKSIIENYEGADLVKIAQDKLNAIIETEKLEEQKKAEELLKIQNEPGPVLNEIK